MDVRPGYQQTEVGVIPDEWQAVRVGDVCGCIVPGRNKPKLFDGNIPWITTPDLEAGKPVTTSKFGLCISRAEAKAVGSKIVPTGSVLMSCAGELGIVALTRNEIVVNQQLHVFVPTERIEAKFLLSALATRKDQIESNGTKTAVPYLNKNACNSILVPLPSVNEQRSIAEALGDADALIDALEQLVAKKRQIKLAAMQELLTGKKRLPEFKTTANYKQTEVGVIPHDWDVRRLPDVCRFRGGKAHERYVSDLGQFVCVNSKFISTDGFVRKYSKANFCQAKQNDVLMVMSDLPNGKALAKAYLVDQDDLYAVNQRVCALTAYRDSPQYLYYVLNRNPYFLKFDDGVSQTHLLNNVFNKCPILLPPTKAEQDAIASVLSDMDAEIAALGAKLAKARQVKQGMMQELLTGKIRLVQPQAASQTRASSKLTEDQPV